MRRSLLWVAGGALALALGAAAQAPAPLMQQTFEEGEGGWTAMGANAAVSITRDVNFVHDGKAALKFAYTVSKGEANALLLPLEAGALTKAQAFHGWVKTDYTATLAMVLQEKDGGRYVSLFNVPGNRWLQVEFAPTDFLLMEGNDDPKDPNGKLDLAQVEALGIGDFGQFFVQAGNPDLEKLLNVKPGGHALYLDDLRVTSEPLPPAFSATATEVRLDTFVRPQLSWLAIGDAKISRSEGKPLEGRGLRADYTQAQGSIAGIVRRIPRGKLAGMGQLSFTAVADKPLTLVVQVEEKGGGKYNAMVEIPGGQAPKNVAVDLTALNAAQDSQDSNSRLDLDMVEQIILIDPTGLFGGGGGENTLWIGPLRATAK